MSKDFVVGLVSGVIIGGVTVAVAMDKVFRDAAEARINEEAEQIRLDYARYNVDQGKPSLDSMKLNSVTIEDDVTGEGLVELIRKDQSKSREILNAEYGQVSEVPEDVNIFDKSADEKLALELDVDNRQMDIPYLISREEYEEGHPDINDQFLLTYFEGDDTLVDSRDQTPIQLEEEVGDTLTRFGYDPRYKDTIYVRNEQTGCDYQITQDKRKYETVVLGIPDDDERPDKNREDD